MRKLAIIALTALAGPALAQAPAQPLSTFKGDPVAGAKLFNACKVCHATTAVGSRTANGPDATV